MASRPGIGRGVFLALCCQLVWACTGLARVDEPGLEVVESDRGHGGVVGAGARVPVGGVPSVALAARFQAQAQALRVRGLESCVDWYYRAAVVAYACMREAPADARSMSIAEALAIYNRNVGECLHAAASFGRIRPSTRLIVKVGGDEVHVPIEHAGFVWEAADFTSLVDPSQVKADPKLERRHVRAGLGARSVALRYASPGQERGFLPLVSSFPITAVLEPDLAYWLGDRQGPPLDRLVLADPFRIRRVVVGDRSHGLTADLDAGLAVMQRIVDPDRLRVDGFLNPASWRDRAGIYFLEPYQAGKIPVLLVHGLASTPWTWSDLIGDLRSDPTLSERFQIWVFMYPTGTGFFQSSRLLRESMGRVLSTIDPEGGDEALNEMVLIGHSMGGLLSRIMISTSGEAVWNTYATVPFDRAVMTDEARDWVTRTFYFAPQDHIRRVIFIATPHRGSHLADAALGRFASSLVRPPDDVRNLYEQLKRDNPGLLRRPFRKLPTSVDLLQRDNPLLETMVGLPLATGVPFHTIAGVGKPGLDGESSDGVVPLSSARLEGATSELLVPATHGTIHHHRQSVAEVRGIMRRHLEEISLRWPPNRSGLASRPSEWRARQDRESRAGGDTGATSLPSPH